MRFILLFFLIAAMPFFNFPQISTNLSNNSSLLVAQEEEEMEEEEIEEEEEVNEEELEGEEKEHVPERLKFYRERYEETYNAPFEIVWTAVLESLDESGCAYMSPSYRLTEEGFYKGVIKSDFCILSLGTDTTFDVMSKYSFKLPFIRGGTWDNLRIQYKFIIKQVGDQKVTLLLKAELSGLENHVTEEYHFWKSNGILEKNILDEIAARVGGQG